MERFLVYVYVKEVSQATYLSAFVRLPKIGIDATEFSQYCHVMLPHDVASRCKGLTCPVLTGQLLLHVAGLVNTLYTVAQHTPYEAQLTTDGDERAM
jgi:hypothetical protein